MNDHMRTTPRPPSPVRQPVAGADVMNDEIAVDRYGGSQPGQVGLSTPSDEELAPGDVRRPLAGAFQVSVHPHEHPGAVA
jgi:hypothetical protein